MPKLDSVLKINNTSYEVQAKTAEQVVNPLNIEVAKSLEQAGYENKSFNGSEAETISVISAREGGAFEKPISVPSLATLETTTPTDTQVLNYGDISEMVAKLSGSGWYMWEEESLNAVVVNNVYQHLGIVLGAYTDLCKFAEHNNEYNILPRYLYICTDEANSGNLYYGISANEKKEAVEGIDFIQIVNKAKELKSTTTTHSYTADSLFSELDKLKSDLSGLDDKVNSNDAGLRKYVDDQDKTLDTKIKATDTKVNSAQTQLNNMTSNDSTNHLKVNNAAQADNATTLDGEDIEYFQKKITVKNSEPTSNDGVVGDIWIVWK